MVEMDFLLINQGIVGCCVRSDFCLRITRCKRFWEIRLTASWLHALAQKHESRKPVKMRKYFHFWCKCHQRYLYFSIELASKMEGLTHLTVLPSQWFRVFGLLVFYVLQVLANYMLRNDSSHNQQQIWSALSKSKMKLSIVRKMFFVGHCISLITWLWC